MYEWSITKSGEIEAPDAQWAAELVADMLRENIEAGEIDVTPMDDEDDHELPCPDCGRDLPADGYCQNSNCKGRKHEESDK
jgi:hypothetical protein